MIWEVSPITPFIVKNGNKLSLMDLYEDGDKLFKINTDKLLESLDENQIKELNAIFEDFIGLKLNSSRDKRYASQNYDKYEELWKRLQTFYKSNNAGKFRFMPGVIKDHQFKRYLEFDENAYVESIKAHHGLFIPYIPGSTVKGLIRRMLIYEYLKRKGNKGKIFDLQKNSEDWKSIDNYMKSIMKYIQVSDFYPSENFEVKMMLTTRIPGSVSTDIPMIYSGKFYGEVNINSTGNSVKDEFQNVGISGSVAEMEEQLFNTITFNSSYIIRKNQEKFAGEFYLGPENDNKLFSIGFGKGISLSGFAAIKDELNIVLPEIRTRSTGGRTSFTEQGYPKTNVVVSLYNGEKVMKGKIGILRAEIYKECRFIKDLPELKYLFQEGDAN